jgi:predicted metalloprotease with PDZ domain
VKPARLLLGGLAVLAFARPAGAAIQYRISVAQPEQHVFHVTMTVPAASRELVVAMPAWNALYQIRDFAHHVANLRAGAVAQDAGEPAVFSVTKLDKQTWRISAAPDSGAKRSLGNVAVSYAVYWDEPGPFSSQLNSHHGFVNLADVLLYVPDRRVEDASIEFADLPADWKLAVELKPGRTPNSFVAPSYDELVDAPAELGQFSGFGMDVNGARLRVVVDGGPWKQGQLGDALRRIVAYETGLMRGAPFEQYTFFFHFGPVSDVGWGGMEHENSTAIATVSSDAAAEVAAHEFFHLWNVKRIRPQSLEPVDYSREQWTRALWFAEGVTSTYGNYALLRCGLWNRPRFLAHLADQLSWLELRPARRWKSVEEASLDAWFEKYDLYSRPDLSISYYNKGEILGDFVDLLIRDATGDHASLDDVLRGLNDRFARRGRFYNDSADIRAVAEQVAGRGFEEFFRRYVSGTDEIPYDDFLALAGLHVKSETRANANFGFWPSEVRSETIAVTGVEPDSDAAAAGLREGDILLKLNGAPFPRDPWNWLRSHAPGETVRVRVGRRGAERDLSFALASREERSYEIVEIQNATEKQRRIREGWLRGATE